MLFFFKEPATTEIYTRSLHGDLPILTLGDPENMILAQNVVPLAVDGLPDEATAAIDAVTAELTTDALIDLNVQSVVDQRDAAGIATEWLESVGLA